MRYLSLLVLLLFTSTTGWACSCWGTASIQGAIASHPVLVEGQVVSLEQSDHEEFGKLTHSATLRVTKVLKGSVDSSEITVVHTMCYATLTPGEMKTGHTYLLPLSAPAPELPPPENGQAVATVGAQPGEYEMAQCSDSGLEIIDGDVYRIEHEFGRERRWQRHMSYSAFRVWMPIAQAALGALIFTWSLHDWFGPSALALALVLGTAGAYFAARHRPWLLVPVLLLTTVLGLVNLAVLLTGERSALYWALFWIAPAIILGGLVLGFRVRRRARTATSPVGRDN